MILAIGLMILGILSRSIVHIPNFTPVIAIALFSGVYIPRKYALVLPIAMLAISDLIIGFHDTMLFTYASLVLIATIGIWLKQHRSVVNTLMTGFAASVLFFIITNFGVWFVGGLYPRTMAGLVECFVMAIPFFRNEVISTFLYCGLLFYGYEILAARIKFARAV